MTASQLSQIFILTFRRGSAPVQVLQFIQVRAAFSLYMGLVARRLHNVLHFLLHLTVSSWRAGEFPDQHWRIIQLCTSQKIDILSRISALQPKLALQSSTDLFHCSLSDTPRKPHKKCSVLPGSVCDPIMYYRCLCTFHILRLN
jgi:hypothetical protein